MTDRFWFLWAIAHCDQHVTQRPNPRPRHSLSALWWYPGVWRPVRHNASKAGCNCMQIWHAATDTDTARDQASRGENMRIKTNGEADMGELTRSKDWNTIQMLFKFNCGVNVQAHFLEAIGSGRIKSHLSTLQNLMNNCSSPVFKKFTFCWMCMQRGN